FLIRQMVPFSLPRFAKNIDSTYIVQRLGIVVTRDDLMNVVWGFDYIGGQRTVDVHVSSLRKKLEMNQQSVQIESIRGVGYKLVVYQPK
ncbi:winged helix-turn-helix domain-containing protein, partial [Paenibacillus larvae]